MAIMLDQITTIDFTPGHNIKGLGVSANWFFLLPRLDQNKVVCIGAPSKQILLPLHFFSSELICTKTVSDEDVIVQPLDQIPTSSVDFIYVLDTRSVKPASLKRILKPNGLLYYDYYGQDRTGFAIQGEATRFWLTPTVGEMQTAVYIKHKHSIEFIRKNHLYASSLRHTNFEKIGKLLTRYSPLIKNTKPESTGLAFAKRSPIKLLKSILKTMLRKSRNLLVEFSPKVEQKLVHGAFTRRWLHRYGMIVWTSKGKNGELPHYLKSRAEQCGFDLTNWEWALVAKGDFPSQKLLFYLFQPNAPKPSVIIKMVRTPQYNERLEREYKGLNHLNHLAFTRQTTIPQIKFQGYHHNLFFIGESVLEGQPFAPKSSFDAKCKYASFVVQWILDLGVVTRSDTIGAKVSALLKPMYQRFVEIYQPNESQQYFLLKQLNHLEQARCVPLVFRHGDPGLQNLLITPKDTVAFLDWENAELMGLPLWDLFYFLSAYCVKAGEMTGKFSTLEAYEKFFLTESPIQPLILDAVNRYCKAVNVEQSLVIPLYYLFWMYRALKQAPMVSHSRIQNAINWQLVKLNISLYNSTTLQSFV